MTEGERRPARRRLAALANLLAVLAGLFQAGVALAILILPLFGACEPTLGSISDAPAGACYAYWEYGNAAGYQLLLTLAVLGVVVAVVAPLTATWRGGLRWAAALFGLPWSLFSFGLGWVLVPVALLTFGAVALAEGADWFARRAA